MARSIPLTSTLQAVNQGIKKKTISNADPKAEIEVPGVMVWVLAVCDDCVDGIRNPLSEQNTSYTTSF
jgi:hypothetical protein